MDLKMRGLTAAMTTACIVLGMFSACGQSSAGGGTVDSSAAGGSGTENSVVTDSSSQQAGAGDSSAEEVTDTLKTTFIKCGKADIIVLECGDRTMVIDTGEDDDGDKITEYMADQGIEKVDDLIITHFDKDHVGGAAFLLDSVPVDRVYVPDYDGSNNEYRDFMKELQETEAELIRLTEGTGFDMGDAHVTIDPPSDTAIPDDNKEYDNDMSLVTIVEHGDNILLFMGDAETARMQDFVSKNLVDRCDLIKAPHHGEYYTAFEEIVKALKPAYAVITDSWKNPAEEKTLNALERLKVQTFSTSTGDVTAVSDGAKLTVTAED